MAVDESQFPNIRSFVRRTNTLNERQERVWQRLAADYVTDLSSFNRLIENWCFEVLEVGIGNGENILAAAAQHPGRNFLGFEVYRPGIASALLKLQHQPLPNLHFVNADFTACLPLIPVNSIEELWIYFPDPWPKLKHRKRRLIAAQFITACENILVSGGRLSIATDWSDYAKQIHRVLSNSQMLLPILAESNRVQTKFESRAIAAGREIFDFEYCKQSTRKQSPGTPE